MRKVPLDSVKERAQQAAPSHNPLPILAGGEVCVIAEVAPTNRASQGTRRLEELAGLAGEFEAGGAHCVSVWTDQQVHGASMNDLTAVRSAVDIPVLARDFIVCSYQLWEARAAGADMVLIMASLLEPQALVSLVERSMSLGMVPVVQVVNECDVVSAATSGATLVAIHADRSCAGLEHGAALNEDPHQARRRFAELVPLMPSSVLRIADVGVRDPHELIEFGQAGADAVVVGSTLTSTKRPKAAVHDLVTAGSHPAVRHARQ
jgi:indole-3-glycerol phosphate synthase